MACTLTFTLSACSPSDKDISSNSTEKVLRLALRDDVKTLDPANSYDSVSLTVLPLALESLYQYSYLKRPLQLEPLLAEGMPSVSKDGLTYTITIKKDVMFQDDPAFPGGKGRELTSSDFIYEWKRLLHPALRSNGSWIFEDKVIGYTEMKQELTKAKKEDWDSILAKPMAGFSAVDKYTIQIKLTKPYPQLLYVLAMGFCAPVAEEVIAKYGQQGINNRMVGTGPYMMKELIRGSRITMVKNPTFRKAYYPAEGDQLAMDKGLLASAEKTHSVH